MVEFLPLSCDICGREGELEEFLDDQEKLIIEWEGIVCRRCESNLEKARKSAQKKQKSKNVLDRKC